MAEEFNADNFRETVGQLHDAMAHGKDQKELLTQCLSLLEKCSQVFDRMQRSQGDVAKSLRRLEGEVGYSNERADAILYSMQALLKTALRQIDTARGTSAPAKTAVGKSRWPLSAVKDPEPASVALDEDPEALIKKGLLAQAMQKFFGPKGGREVAYDKALAARMLEQGSISKAEHANWKRFHRLPDHVQIAS